ncbi:N-acetylglucosaminyl-phosphatidylinositol de-N-acetylase, putative [Candida dubliniensis CD36]|uniref:N-acetylglucosaminylphosphatidylinositol deacetylase n=1 Tax=Candida dubliniensis (strain CD36 / ATCC MYA-646 / CBS 7987 / NCPF 3949 / NRRL Y-17841) TaxID=573826 RepID=B9W945_CANDC|nr:N-acetylglucosaminyl-phosphatidylinositol de-N-acetylase, putative [Candida dubliniensis CD36]CAX45281.1 N-acetylglucosaminyl-phosphatidylinositol de-N-acetylase, putative [Candida dubliniensis CD36]
MIFKLPLILLKLYIISFIIWIFQTTILPQTLTKLTNVSIKTQNFHHHYPYTSIVTTPKNSNSINTITNSNITYIIAHPDDEVMFFAPSIIELKKAKYNNQINLICFSKGNYIKSMDEIRQSELIQSSRILGIDQVSIFDYQDGMNETWQLNDIVQSLHENLSPPINNNNNQKQSVLITFDDQGVSNHPNHISLFHGTKKYIQDLRKSENKNKTRIKTITNQNDIDSSISTKFYVLKSLNFFEKYSFTLLGNIEILFNYISLLIKKFINININVSFFSNQIKSKLDTNNLQLQNLNDIRFYSDLNMLSLSYAAMAYGHFSQMVWFRYAWLLLSRYLTYNHLIEQ